VNHLLTVDVLQNGQHLLKKLLDSSFANWARLSNFLL